MVAVGAMPKAILIASIITIFHPLHTSLAELSFTSGGAVSVTLRVFADDYAAAAEDHRKRSIPSAGARAVASPVAGYALASFTIADESGRTIPLRECGGKRVADLMWLCFRGHVRRTPAGLRVSSRILFDMFDDQINIVQVTYGGRKTNLLFTRGDESRTLR